MRTFLLASALLILFGCGWKPYYKWADPRGTGLEEWGKEHREKASKKKKCDPCFSSEGSGKDLMGCREVCLSGCVVEMCD